MEFLVNRLGEEVKVKLYLGGFDGDILCADIYTKYKFLGFEFWRKEKPRPGVYYVKGTEHIVNWVENDYLSWVIGIVKAGVSDEEKGILAFNKLNN
jgi:hypothetical protein